MKIKSIRKVSNRKMIDIGVKKNQNFFANGILTHNCNLPAKNVVILGTNRGIQPLDMADIIQMAGRAGRLGLDDIGYCHLMCLDNKTSQWAHNVQQSPKVASALLDPMHLRFQILAEVDLGILKTPDDIPKWFDKTLVGQQVEYPDRHFKEAIQRLVQMDMLRLGENNKLEVTQVGKVGTSLYFTPDDIYHWYKFLKNNPVVDSDSKIAVLIGGAPTLAQNYVPKEYEHSISKLIKACNVDKVNHKIKHPFTPYALLEHLQGNANDQFALKFHIQGIAMDIERIDGALTKLAELTKTNLPSDLTLRIKHGVPKQLSFLCNIPGIGPKKAWLLYTAGVTNPSKLESTDKSTLVTCLGTLTAKKVWEYLHQD